MAQSRFFLRRAVVERAHQWNDDCGLTIRFLNAASSFAVSGSFAENAARIGRLQAEVRPACREFRVLDASPVACTDRSVPPCSFAFRFA
jgi:hypothetical protein